MKNKIRTIDEFSDAEIIALVREQIRVHDIIICENCNTIRESSFLHCQVCGEELSKVSTLSWPSYSG